MSTKPQTLHSVIHTLTAADKAILVRVLQQRTIRYSGVHQGLLPFVDMEMAIQAMVEECRLDNHGRRRFHKIRQKLLDVKPYRLLPIKYLHLNDRKVAKWFGTHPERGKPVDFLGTKKVIAGLKWSLAKQAYVPDTEVLVKPVVALKPVKKGLWEVVCSEEHRKEVELWLIDHCR